MKTVLAFLQNPWFKPGTDPRLIHKYQVDPDFHRRVLLLSATGRALYDAFGPQLYHEIIWDNANPRHGNVPTARMRADPQHMAETIVRHRPDLILCFGHEAAVGMNKLVSQPWPNVMYAAHPMAHGSAQKHLEDIVREVRKWLRINHDLR